VARRKRATRATQKRTTRSARRRPKLSVDLGALERVVVGLRDRGFIREADQLDEALHRTAYPNTTDMLLEIAVALRASYRRARRGDAALERDFHRAARELRKARSDYEL
jgi:replicative superfamily II helicase